MSIGAAFLKGAADWQLDRMSKREDVELEMKKARMLEELRRETAKELAEFEENLPSKKLEREKKIQDMEFAREDQGMARERHGMEKEGFELDKGYKALDYQYKAEDQQMQRQRLALDQASTAESIATNRAQRARLAREDKESAKADNILFREWEDLKQHVTGTGLANEAELAGMQSTWYNGVNQAGWTKEKQRQYIQLMYDRFKRKSDVMRAKGHLPSQKKDDLGLGG